MLLSFSKDVNSLYHFYFIRLHFISNQNSQKNVSRPHFCSWVTENSQFLHKNQCWAPWILQVQRIGLTLNFHLSLRFTPRSEGWEWAQWLISEPFFPMDSFYRGLNLTHNIFKDCPNFNLNILWYEAKHGSVIPHIS